MRVGPGRIEIHVDGKRTGAPDGNSGKEGPALFDILSGKQIGKKQAKETIGRGAKRHGQEIRGRKTISGDMRTKRVCNKHKRVRCQQERTPKDGRSNGEEVSDVPGPRVLVRTKLTVGESSRLRKIKVRVPPVFLESQIVLDEKRASVSVVSDAVPVHDRIEQEKRENPEKEKQPLRLARRPRGR